MRMRIGKFSRQVAWMAVVVGVVGCGSSDSNRSPTAADASQGQTVELLSYLVKPGDADALQALINVHKSRHPEDQLILTPVDQPSDAEAIFTQRVAAGNLPDVTMLLGSQLTDIVQSNGPNPLYPLDDFLASPSQAGTLPSILPEPLSAVKVDGKTYGLPSGMLCWNVVIYNKQVFAAHQLNPPTTIDEFRTVSQALKAAGVTTPVGAVGTTKLLNFIFADLLVGVMGIDAFHSYVTGGAPDETAFRNTIDLFAEMMDNYADLDTFATADSMQPISALMSGKTAMLFDGDWAEGIFQSLGWTPGIDFGIVPAPGNQGLFYYALDTFAIPAGAPHLQGALNFLDTVASLEGATAVQRIKNDSPVRSDLDVSGSDSERRAIVESMRQAKYRITPAGADAPWEGPLQSFMQSTPHDKEALLQVMLTVPYR